MSTSDTRVKKRNYFSNKLRIDQMDEISRVKQQSKQEDLGCDKNLSYTGQIGVVKGWVNGGGEVG